MQLTTGNTDPLPSSTLHPSLDFPGRSSAHFMTTF